MNVTISDGDVQWPNVDLYYAVAEGDIQRVLEMVGPAENSHWERTALSLAAQCRNRDMVRALLAHGCRISQNDPAPLIGAAAGGDPQIVMLFLELGSNARPEIGKGYTALMATAENGYADVVAILLNAGAEVDARSRKGDTALMLAAGRGGMMLTISL